MKTKGRGTALSLLLFCIIFFSPGSRLNCSILANEPKLAELYSRLSGALEKMEYFSEHFEDLKKEGKYYRNSSNFGVFEGNYGTYFKKDGTSCGFHLYKEGAAVRRFTIFRKDEMTYYTFTDLSSNDELLITLERGIFKYLRMKSGGSIRIVLYSDRQTGHSYAKYFYKNKNVHYRIVNYKGRDYIVLSEELNTILFHSNTPQKKRQIYLDDIFTDSKNLLFTDILRRAVKEKVKLSDHRALALFTTNYLRSLIGLPEVKYSPLLEQAGFNHLKYVHKNWQNYTFNSKNEYDLDVHLEVHYEKEGYPGFTGEKWSDRAKYVGFEEYRLTTECGGGGSNENPIGDILNFFETVYHRRPYISREVTTISYSFLPRDKDKRAIAVSMYAYSGKKGPDVLVSYPYDGAENCAVSWNGVEAPQPLKGIDPPFGPVLSFAYTDSAYSTATVELFDNKGKKVPLYNELRKDKIYRKNYLEVIPVKPLAYNSSYILRLTDGDTTKEVSFSTKPEEKTLILMREYERKVTVDFPPARIETLFSKKADPDFDRENIIFDNSLLSKDGKLRITSNNFHYSVLVSDDWNYEESKKWSNPFTLRKGKSFFYFVSYFQYPTQTVEKIVASHLKDYKKIVSSKELLLNGTPALINYYPERGGRNFAVIYIMRPDRVIQVHCYVEDYSEITIITDGLELL